MRRRSQSEFLSISMSHAVDLTHVPYARWLYTLYLMIDANFRARCKDRGIEDIELAPGWAYYVEEKAYQAHVAACKGQKEV